MVHYQSRAQVPAPCVGKARRPPVLQVSTTQTPGRGAAVEGTKEGCSVAAATRPVSLFLLCCESSQPRVQTQVVGAGRERSGVGWGGGRGAAQGTTVYYLWTWFEGSRGGFGPLHSPTQFQG